MDRTESSIIALKSPVLRSIEFVEPESPQQQGPIEIKMRKTLATLKGTSYQDKFDWSIYDKISAKFGDEPPRGGVVFNTTLKLVNYHSTCSKCHYAFEIDTYGRGCVHNCTYCYAKEVLTRHGYWNQPHAFPVNLAEIRKIFYTVFETERPSKWRSVLGARVPLRIGSMSDSFSWMDRKYGVTKELLRILSHYRYPYIVFTRSDLISTDEYQSVLDPKLASIQFSISGGNEELTKKLEPGAPSVARRLQALTALAKSGFWTTVRINPLFPIYPDGYFTDPESIKARFGSHNSVPKFDLFDWDFIAELKAHDVPSVLAGFVRLTPFAIREISKAAETDFSKFFKPENFSKTSDSKFSDAEIGFYYRRIAQESFKNRIRYGTCFIGNGLKDYYQYQDLWSNKRDCCDAIGNVPSFKTSSQNIPWSVRSGFAPNTDIASASQKAEQSADVQFTAVPNNRLNFGAEINL